MNARRASWFVTGLLLLFSVLVIHQSASAATDVLISLQEYILADTPNEHLCSSGIGAVCIDGHWEGANEFAYTISNGIVDFLGVVTKADGSKILGVMRNMYQPSQGVDILRCFSVVGQWCTAPATANALPWAVKYSDNGTVFVRKISTNTFNLTLNADGITPKKRIKGTPQTAGWESFDVNHYDNTTHCAQVVKVGVVEHQVWAAIVAKVNFGGEMGEKTNVLVIDEIQRHSDGTQHIERYYFVKDFGRVRESWAWDEDGDGIFNSPHPGYPGDSNRNIINTGDITSPGYSWFCPQGGGFIPH